MDVYDTEETVSAAGNFLGIRRCVSDGVSVEGASVDGAVLTLTFSEALDGSSVPVASAFSVRGASSDGVTPAYAVDSVRVSGVEVRLTLTMPVAPGTTGVTVSYAKPAGGNVLSAADGDEVDSFSGESVTVEGEPVSPTGPGADSAAGGGVGGCSLASAGGAGIVSAAFMLRLSGSR